jgi:hypothetical protein
VTKQKFIIGGIIVLLVVLQLFDIVIHAATDQLETIRVASNVIILVWLVAVASGRIHARSVQAAAGAIGAYLGLNILFLALEGVTNPNQDGALRVTLFALVFLTVVLSTLFAILHRRYLQRERKPI